MPYQKQGYKEGDSFTDKGGTVRQVVAVIGDFGPKPTIVVTDVKGMEHNLSPSVPLGAYSVLSTLLPEIEGQQSEHAILTLINTVSELCIKDAPYFTPEYIAQNFDVTTIVKMIEAVINVAAGLVHANIKQYTEDESVKNVQSGTNRSKKGGYRNQKRRSNGETGPE
jgi:hypothetical protein